MRNKFRFKANTGLAMALAAGLALSGVTMGAAPAYAAKNSKEFLAVAAPLQKKMDELEKLKTKADAGDAAAKAQVESGAKQLTAEVQAAQAAAKTEDDKLIAGQFGVTLGGMSGDMKLRQNGAQMMVDSGKLKPDQLPTYQFYLGNFAYGAGDYPAAAKALNAALDAGFQHEQLVPLMLQAFTKANMGAQGLAAAKKAFDARKAAGQPIPQDWISRANVVAYQAKSGPDAIAFSTMLVDEYPSNFNWLASAQMIRTFGGLDPQATLDLFRLMDRSGALDNEAQYVAGEYKEYIETADPRKNPGEVVAIIQKATSGGKLSASDASVADARTNASGRIAADKASLPGLVREAKGAADGKTALLAGDVALNYADATQAEQMYSLALQKGGIDANTALTRLGIAQYDLGKLAEAKASFAKVTGPRTTVAGLWSVLAGNKMPSGS